MILYFADRNLNILGQASTHLPKGVKVVEDLTTEDLETGVSIFECDIPFDRSTRAKVEEWAELGNYILKSSDGENKLYSIIDAEIDTKKQRVTIYAEDDGLDLLNEVVGEYEADQYYPIAYYVEKYAAGSGWEIGINEVEGLTRKLNLDSEETTHARLLKIAAAFNNCNLSFSFDIDGLQVKKKYINIYAERGKDTGEQLRLNKEIDGIITTKSIANLATALQVTGGTPDNAETPITLSGYAYDDGDFYIEGSILKSRKALEKWQRFLWKNDETQQAGGHIVKQYSSDTLSQEELCLNAIEELKLVCDMEINFEVDATEFPENARIGDRVNIIDDEGELYLSSRILILETSEANGTRTAVLGEHLIRKSGISAKVEKLAAQFAKTSVTAARANMLANNANEIAEEAKTQAETALNEANAVTGIAEDAKAQAEAAQEAALNAKAEAEAAEAAANAVVEKVEGFETAINNAQAAADNAYTAAETATQKAAEAETAANNALTELETSKEAMQAAQNTAENAISKAETAENTAATAKSEAEAASTTARAAKLDAEQAQKEIDNLSLELTTVEQTMTAEYARKTDLTEATADLQTQISQNAAEISSTASKVTFIDETANNAAAQAQAAFYTAEQAQQEADEATALAVQAQNEADTAQQAADNAQAEADTARQAAETAQSVADQAEADLIQAQKDLDEIRASATATEAEIAAAELAVQNAQTTATNAQAEAAEAVTVANNAQAAADTAVTNAVNAQNYADYAAKQAEIAQLAAEKVSESAAAQAMQKANDAQSTADTAQNTANTAKANADNAQSIANTAAATAANAQAIADEAKSDMQKAEADLQEAKQTLADVTSRVDATEEEVQAAQAAVATAQSKADEAKANAQAAQATADTAKANAATAQTAANNAKTAADNAQTAADEAQAAADKALEDVGKLETRLTTAETKITQNSEQIKLMATKTEVTTALNGYYTKSETDAAISVKADEINLNVTEQIDGVKATNSASGSVITLTDSSDGGLIDLKIYGKTEQNGTPTPEAPAPLVSVGDGGFNFRAYSKNLADYSKITAQNYGTDATIAIKGNVVELYASANGFYLDDLVMQKGVTYIISGYALNATNVRIYPKNQFANVADATMVPFNPATGAFYFTYTPLRDDMVFRIWTNGATVPLTDFMIRVADIADDTYEPCNSQTLEFPYTLRSWNNVKDEVDLNRGVLIQRCDAANNFSLNRTFTNTKLFSGTFKNTCLGLSPGAGKSVCSHTNNYAYVYANGDYVHYYVERAGAMVWLPIDFDETQASEIEVIGILETPIEIPLTDEELAAYAALHTNNPITTIFAEGSPEMYVEYFSNTKEGQALAKNTASIHIASDRISSRVAAAQSDADDNAQSISEAETNIEQLSDQISTLVQDGSGKSLMTQTSSGWVFSMGDFEEALNNLLAHIKIGTYNGQPCLELVVDDTKQKLMLTNTEIRFMESDTTAAYVSGNTMNIDHAQIDNALTIGSGYDWAEDSDEILNLIYQ